MAFGFGPGTDMNRSIQANRKLVKGRKKLKDASQIYDYNGSGETRELLEPSEEEILSYRAKLKEEKIQRQKKLIVSVSAITLIILALFYFMMFT